MAQKTRMRLSVCLPVFALLASHAAGKPDMDSLSSRPIVRASRISHPITIDGILSEQEWQQPGITQFTQRNPDEGSPPTQKTEVWVAFDDAALYVAARMYDTSPDSIVSRIGRRDDIISADWFYVSLDPYHDRRTGFYFGVDPGGAIQDGTNYNDEETDNTWDGIWEVAANIDSLGWTAEFRIPFSQLRFPTLDEYVWGINFERLINRRNEEDYFVMVPKKESGAVSRYADLVGIREIHPPPRLEVLPYFVSSETYTNDFTAGDPFNSGSKANANIGGDVKVGIGSNMTVNGTINPDFGQVEVDPAVVNLTEYQTYFDEKRPFFVEGSSIFSFGHGGLNNRWGFNWSDPIFFYSRRIGRPPEGLPQHVGFDDIPDKTTIIAAAKLTGKLSEGWSIGSVHAITAQEDARVQDSLGNRYTDIVEPLTSYNVVRALRVFNDGAQGIGFIGTAAFRDLNQSYLANGFSNRAYCLGVDGWTNLDADRMWVLSNYAAVSRIEGSAAQMLNVQQSAVHYYQEPDASFLGLDSNATSMSGYVIRSMLNKQKGNWKFNGAVGVMSPGFETNDLGFLYQANEINAHAVVGYQWYEPDGLFRLKGINVATYRVYDFGGNRVGDGYYMFASGQFMNYWNADANASYLPPQLDNTQSHGGPLMASLYEGYNGGADLSTDSRKEYVYSAGIFGATKRGRRRWTTNAGVEWKPGNGIRLSVAPYFDHDITDPQWVTTVADPLATQTYGMRYVFSAIEQKEFGASVRLDWTFSPKLTLQLFLQPLISVGRYYNYEEFLKPRTLDFTLYGTNGSTITSSGGVFTVDPDGPGPATAFAFADPDFNYKSLRGNAVLRWEYLPGSTIYFAWTLNRTNLINPGDFNFQRDFGDLFGGMWENVFLVKISYWLNP